MKRKKETWTNRCKNNGSSNFLELLEIKRFKKNHIAIIKNALCEDLNLKFDYQLLVQFYRWD